MTTMNPNINTLMNWMDYQPSFKIDAMTFILAVALHVPLYFMKVEQKRHVDIESKGPKLAVIDVINELPKKEEAPPPPAPKAPSWKDKLASLVKRTPPPPPPPPKLAPKPPEALPKPNDQIKIEPKLNLGQNIPPKLETKTGFQGKDAKLIQDKQIKLAQLPSTIAPLTAKQLGVVDNTSKLKSKNDFRVSKSESLHSIGGDKGLSDPSAPTIAIKTGAQGKQELFSKAPPQVMDKGIMGSLPSSGFGTDSNLTMREKMIMRDAKPSMIATGGSSSGKLGGVPGGEGTATKKDAGRYSGSGLPGGLAGGTGSTLGATGVGASQISGSVPTKRAEKKSFVISGPLQNRAREREVKPEYTAQAQAEGKEGSVMLQFTVDANGYVKDTILVQRTSGYHDLDESARKALLKWKFVPLTDGANREEVGTITFNFSLS